MAAVYLGELRPEASETVVQHKFQCRIQLNYRDGGDKDYLLEISARTCFIYHMPTWECKV